MDVGRGEKQESEREWDEKIGYSSRWLTLSHSHPVLYFPFIRLVILPSLIHLPYPTFVYLQTKGARVGFGNGFPLNDLEPVISSLGIFLDVASPLLPPLCPVFFFGCRGYVVIPPCGTPQLHGQIYSKAWAVHAQDATWKLGDGVLGAIPELYQVLEARCSSLLFGGGGWSLLEVVTVVWGGGRGHVFEGWPKGGKRGTKGEKLGNF